jgi:hypothetical protein
MRRFALALLMVMPVAGQVSAADKAANQPTTAGGTMGQLVADGYEIKAAVPNGKKVIIFLQKDSTAYACELMSLTQTVCGVIN